VAEHIGTALVDVAMQTQTNSEVTQAFYKGIILNLLVASDRMMPDSDHKPRIVDLFKASASLVYRFIPEISHPFFFTIYCNQ
jgi:hypothetical protein